MLPSKSNYYEDAAPAPAGQPEAAEESTTPETEGAQEGGQDGGATAEVPKSALGGKDFKPGEEVVMQVVKVLGDSVLLKYSTGAEEEQEPPAEEGIGEAPPPRGGGGPMSEMLG